MSLLQALGLARRPGASSFELRAAISLARLRQAQAKPRQGRALLTEVYAQVDEGFDAADLKEAKEFLDDRTARGASLSRPSANISRWRIDTARGDGWTWSSAHDLVEKGLA